MDNSKMVKDQQRTIQLLASALLSDRTKDESGADYLQQLSDSQALENLFAQDMNDLQEKQDLDNYKKLKKKLKGLTGKSDNVEERVDEIDFAIDELNNTISELYDTVAKQQIIINYFLELFGIDSDDSYKNIKRGLKKLNKSIGKNFCQQDFWLKYGGN